MDNFILFDDWFISLFNKAALINYDINQLSIPDWQNDFARGMSPSTALENARSLDPEYCEPQPPMGGQLC